MFEVRDFRAHPAGDVQVMENGNLVGWYGFRPNGCFETAEYFISAKELIETTTKGRISEIDRAVVAALGHVDGLEVA